jgi:hypothetical protein
LSKFSITEKPPPSPGTWSYTTATFGPGGGWLPPPRLRNTPTHPSESSSRSLHPLNSGKPQ